MIVHFVISLFVSFKSMLYYTFMRWKILSWAVFIDERYKVCIKKLHNCQVLVNFYYGIYTYVNRASLSLSQCLFIILLLKITYEILLPIHPQRKKGVGRRRFYQLQSFAIVYSIFPTIIVLEILVHERNFHKSQV